MALTKFLAEIDAEILQGCPHARHRLTHAAQQIHVFKGEFHDVRGDTFLFPWHHDDQRSDRHLLAMQRIIDALTSNLYKTAPGRIVPASPAATQFLAKTYGQNRVDALMCAADKLVHAADEVALQVSGTTDPNCPVKIHLWDAAHFLAYTDPQDPLTVVAVVTLDKDGGRDRYRLYTAENVITYLTDEPLPGQAGEPRPHRAKVEPNPYTSKGEGVLPFAFIHHNLPTTSFYSGGPGATLAEMNRHLNFRLSDLADAQRFSRPIATIEGTDPTFVPPKWTRPGDWLHLPSGKIDSRGEKTEPKLNFTGPSLAFVESEWADLQHYFDLTLQTVGVPPSAVRLEQTTARSGASIVAEHIPLLLYARGRQTPFEHYECDLGKVVLLVAAAHLRNNNLVAGELEAALEDYGLMLRWGDVWPDLPGPDRDAADKWLLDHGLTSRIQILMRRHGWVREEAIEYLEQVAEDGVLEQTLVGAEQPPDEETEPDEQTERPQGAEGRGRAGDGGRMNTLPDAMLTNRENYDRHE